ncbi:TonB-dependent receptor [Neolewinella lacunae]|uniref:TonB-dependent receptor n=1 Tax=Neolewinella lacunae TaxID=1517758 RepID=A0A923PML8_9BACT|nr:TonB-dependent receptor [Neolewinella lacunae]MBC6995496.1 TonB-dependent receptor [Neolewinella lacunae]MDN3635084.1 TonB-dependent receptor [Neolewinella lacunae]
MKRNHLLTTLLLALTSLTASAQTAITGKVYDAQTTDLLTGATVLVKGTSNGTSTDLNGAFSLSYGGTYPATLVISYVGYEGKQVEVADNQPVEIYLLPSSSALNEVTVTARRRSEEVQEIPIPIAVIGARELDNSTSFNVNRVKELVPSVQLYSSNPRNTTLNIRGIGSTFGLTNDGIDPGVGFYVDGVYYARPAATTLDFIDIQQIEVLRGPQGTLFGKNTTAGTFNITSRKPTFSTSGIFEQSFGNFGFIQTKASISGPLVKDKVAARLSFTGTHRDGTIYNEASESYTNTLNNQGVRGQVLFLPTKNISINLAADYTRQRPDGYAQVYAGTAPTQRPAFRQFEQIIADLNYELPSRNPFDRVIDTNTPWRSDQDMGGVALNADFALGNGVLTSTTAWRTWEWGPSSDRDFTGLDAINKSQAPSIHHQWSQELRYSGEINEQVNGTVGLFAFYQTLDPIGAHTQIAGSEQWRFVQNNQNPLWETPGLLDGLTQEDRPSFRNFSGALFAQVDWKITEKLIATPGIRFNYDEKEVDFSRKVSGGLVTTDPDLLALQRRVFTPLTFQAEVDDWNISGQLSLRYVFSEAVMGYATYSNGFKPVGLNLGGIPTEEGVPVLDLAVVQPERVSHYEVGVKTRPVKNSTLNLTFFNTDIFNYQTTVRSAEIGVIRGYLANAEQVRTTGIEIEGAYNLPKHLRFTTSVSYTDGKYVKFTNAPVPLEETGSGGNEVKDISGEVLPGISKWSVASGIELFTGGKLIGQKGELFFGTDVFYRSSFSSNPTPSLFLNIDGYALVNARFGFRTQEGITVYVWSRNLTNTDYFEQLLAAGGNAGHYAGVLGDPRTYGITLRYNLF